MRPRIEFDVEGIDNVFASDVVDRNDVTLSLRPAVLVSDRRPDRELTLNLDAAFATFLDNTVSDRVQIGADGLGRFGLGTRTRPFVGFSFRQNDTQSRQFPDLSLTAQPIRLTSIGGNAGVDQEFGPITATAEARYQNTSYRDEIIGDSLNLIPGFEDFEVASGRLRLAYSVNPAQRIYVEGEINDRKFDVNPGSIGAVPGLLVNRSSDGFGLRAGYARQITEILLFDANVGYLRQQYDDPAISTVSSFSFDADLVYSPSRLTRVRLSAGRSIDDTVNQFFNGLLRTEVGLGVEHELRRDFLLSAEGRYSTIDPRASGGATASDIEEFQLSGSARYLISPSWTARFRLSYFDRNATFGGSQLRGLLGLTYYF
ncbi:outer membrane beta-barrel protein [Qipengyuania spongiae]|uniref:Outer membrane beta-barrel protein n=1 Tax=Qipengyuania spongiae TaxID=2909673 RepID=A0ABY5T1D6_9SPHN|nr:outer membrane beta-barrel protein [Qipengyuania spongiae]